MIPQEVIIEKRNGKKLDAQVLSNFINSYVKGEIPDYQVSALLMAIFLQGMDAEETAALTECMMKSGVTYDLEKLGISGPAVDKHSTGGVGDKVSLVLAPLAAACGLVVPMVTGRGLGNTGGTTDKLESIPGFNMDVTPEEFIEQLKKLGVAIIGQADNFVPADKKLYALRDVTGTVESIPLISSSIMSKKVASGAKGIVMDVKVGSGAFMKNPDDARKLADSLKNVGDVLGVKVKAVLSNMDQPLGDTVGNAIEVREAVECLRGGGPEDLRRITLELAAEMALLGDVAATYKEALELVTEKLDSGAALEKFKEIVSYQGGNTNVIDNPELLVVSEETEDIRAETNGFLHSVDCYEVGMAALVLGAGRQKVGEEIDPTVGLRIRKKIGDPVKAGEILVTVHHNGGRGVENCRKKLSGAFDIKENPVQAPSLILEKR